MLWKAVLQESAALFKKQWKVLAVAGAVQIVAAVLAYLDWISMFGIGAMLLLAIEWLCGYLIVVVGVVGDRQSPQEIVSLFGDLLRRKWRSLAFISGILGLIILLGLFLIIPFIYWMALYLFVWPASIDEPQEVNVFELSKAWVMPRLWLVIGWVAIWVGGAILLKIGITDLLEVIRLGPLAGILARWVVEVIGLLAMARLYVLFRARYRASVPEAVLSKPYLSWPKIVLLTSAILMLAILWGIVWAGIQIAALQ